MYFTMLLPQWQKEQTQNHHNNLKYNLKINYSQAIDKESPFLILDHDWNKLY